MGQTGQTGNIRTDITVYQYFYGRFGKIVPMRMIGRIGQMSRMRPMGSGLDEGSMRGASGRLEESNKENGHPAGENDFLAFTQQGGEYPVMFSARTKKDLHRDFILSTFANIYQEQEHFLWTSGHRKYCHCDKTWNAK
ncbi:MAG TPA: hypothetical protein DIW30_08530 [Bacteroidales bacterium]|nr:hypothetical protein [Bacteroidales bacterium]